MVAESVQAKAFRAEDQVFEPLAESSDLSLCLTQVVSRKATKYSAIWDTQWSHVLTLQTWWSNKSSIRLLFLEIRKSELCKLTQWLKNWYVSLPSQVLGIIRLGYGTGWLTVRIIWLIFWDIMSWCWWPGIPLEQHLKVAMTVYCHKLVLAQIWP